MLDPISQLVRFPDLFRTSRTTSDSLPRIVTAIGTRGLTAVSADGDRVPLFVPKTMH